MMLKEKRLGVSRAALLSALSFLLILPLTGGSARCDGPMGLRDEFFYAVIVDSVPYLVLNSHETLYQIQSALLCAQDCYYGLETEPLSDQIYPGGIPPLFRDFRAYGIKGARESYDKLIRLERGDAMVLEKVTRSGDGPRAGAVVEKVMFLSNGLSSGIVIKCGKIAGEILEKLAAREWNQHIIAYYDGGRGVNQTEKREAEQSDIPEAVRIEIGKIADSFLPAGNPGEYPYPRVTTSSVFRKPDEIFYAAVLSYGEKSINGRLVLLDCGGNVIQDTGEQDYNRILGLAGPCGRGPLALVVFYGGRYGGGVELFSFHPRKPLLVSGFRITTVID